jgi:ABC-type uncharacterized transport system auxiliary subunit
MRRQTRRARCAGLALVVLAAAVLASCSEDSSTAPLEFADIATETSVSSTSDAPETMAATMPAPTVTTRISTTTESGGPRWAAAHSIQPEPSTGRSR